METLTLCYWRWWWLIRADIPTLPMFMAAGAMGATGGLVVGLLT